MEVWVHRWETSQENDRGDGGFADRTVKEARSNSPIPLTFFTAFLLYLVGRKTERQRLHPKPLAYCPVWSPHFNLRAM